MCSCICECVNLCVCVCACACTCACARMFACVRVCMCACVRVCVRVTLFVRACVRARVSERVCVSVHVCGRERESLRVKRSKWVCVQCALLGASMYTLCVILALPHLILWGQGFAYLAGAAPGADAPSSRCTKDAESEDALIRRDSVLESAITRVYPLVPLFLSPGRLGRVPNPLKHPLGGADT